MFIGADGCKKGWFTVLLSERNNWKVDIFTDIFSLWNKYNDASLILLDIPIGLLETGFEERKCDKKARKLLGAKRASSIFPTPCRAATYTKSYEQASSINKQKTGRGLSRQVWNIIPKIREADMLLSRDKLARSRIREIHPEICFWALAGYPMKHPKKTEQGFIERRRVLKSVYLHVDDIISFALSNYKRNEVVKDDILDALSAAVTGLLGRKNLNSIPEIPEINSKGLRMEMVFKRTGKNRD